MNETREAVASSAAATPDGARASTRLALLGVAALALTAATPFAFRAGGDNAYMAGAIAAGLVAMAAASVAERAPTSRAFWLILGVAALLRGILLFIEPLLSTDI